MTAREIERLILFAIVTLIAGAAIAHAFGGIS